jgi:hypothetical protein
MQTAGARILPEDNEQELSREAVLLQWERKIEQAERRPSRVDSDTKRSEDGSSAALASAEAVPQEKPRHIGRPAPVVEDATHDGPRRFEQSPAPEAGGRRTITITGHPGPATRRRRSVVESQLAQPDRIALWAFLLGLFLVAVAAGTAHA